MKNIRLIIEYDGTNYHGWQSQKNADTVQNVIEDAIDRLIPNEKCKLIGCSRTDFGVHALGQVANFKTDSTIPPDRFTYALNRLLPEDIVIVRSEEVPDDFHARYSAKGKKYIYRIHNAPFSSALLRHRACHVSHPLDEAAMDRAAKHFIGCHDFTAFQATGGNVRNTFKTITQCDVTRHGAVVTLEITGDGFLYNMVRIIAGTLIEAGKGNIEADTIPAIIESRDRTRAGKTAPAHGLYLAEIYYDRLPEDLERGVRQ